MGADEREVGISVRVSLKHTLIVDLYSMLAKVFCPVSSAYSP